MNIFLDTSYFLPYFKIEVEELPYDFIGNLMKRPDLKIFISEISIAEIIAKSFKLSVFDSNLAFQDIQTGLESLRNDSRIKIVSWYENPKILEISYSLRKIHTDFFDCVIFASAIVEADAIGTFDDSFYHKIIANAKIKKLLLQINPEFKFWFNDFKKAQKSI